MNILDFLLWEDSNFHWQLNGLPGKRNINILVKSNRADCVIHNEYFNRYMLRLTDFVISSSENIISGRTVSNELRVTARMKNLYFGLQLSTFQPSLRS